MKKSCLHLVVKSSKDALERCLSQFETGDSVMFLDDGVMHIAGNHGAAFEPLFKNGCFSAADLEARGLGTFADESGIRVIQDLDFLDLLRNHPLCLTWK